MIRQSETVTVVRLIWETTEDAESFSKGLNIYFNGPFSKVSEDGTRVVIHDLTELTRGASVYTPDNDTWWADWN